MLDHFFSKYKHQESTRMRSVTMERTKDDRARISGSRIYYVRRVKRARAEQQGRRRRPRKSKKEILRGYESGNAVTNARYHSGASDRLYARKMGLVFIEITASFLRGARLYV